MIDWLNTIDTQVFLALNGLYAPYFDVFMYYCPLNHKVVSPTP